MFSNRVRTVLKCWVVVSVIVFIGRLGPVMARYRVDEQKFADLKFEAKQPSAPVVVNDPDSPRPDLTLALTGRAIKNLDDGSISWMHPSFFSQSKMLVVSFQKGWMIDLKQKDLAHGPLEDRIAYELPHGDGRQPLLHSGAISGDGKVLATVGEHTVVNFWDAQTGKLLATIEDDHPTIAARPDQSEYSRKHTNGLRYSETDVRLIVASPTSCLFAIGKVDGTVELWGDLLYRDHPESIEKHRNQFALEKELTHKFGLIARRKLHEGQITDLAFSHQGTKLVSIGGDVVTKYENESTPSGIPGNSGRVTQPATKYELVLSTTSTLEDEWRNVLPNRPSNLALPVRSRHSLPGEHRAPFAVGMWFEGVIVGDLNQKTIAGTIKFPPGGPIPMVQSLSFNRDEDALITLHTSYTPKAENSKDVTIETVLTLWQVGTRRRIATARFPGQFMSAGWDQFGRTLAMVRIDHSHRAQSAVSSGVWPWESSRPSPFMFHIWDVKTISLEH